MKNLQQNLNGNVVREGGGAVRRLPQYIISIQMVNPKVNDVKIYDRIHKIIFISRRRNLILIYYPFNSSICLCSLMVM